MKVVYEAAHLIDAHLVRHALEAAEIPVYLKGESLLGGMGELPLFGVIAVCVPEIVWPQARAIVEAMPMNEPLAADAVGDDDIDPVDGGLLPA